jgi:hypothetical protein
MTDHTQPSPQPDATDEVSQFAADSIADLGNGQAAASVPGASGHDDPQSRREVVDTVFDDPRIHGDLGRGRGHGALPSHGEGPVAFFGTLVGGLALPWWATPFSRRPPERSWARPRR